jgi:nitroreductase
MDFLNLAKARYSCRKYDPLRSVENEKLDKILSCAALSPSACNGQPYHITVCRGVLAKAVAKTAVTMNMNSFLMDAPIILAISEKPYSKTAAIGAKIKKNDYRSIDIGILAANITLAAAELSLGSCIIGWFDDKKIRNICSLDGSVRLLISLGYPLDEPREKKRKSIDELVTEL